MADSEFRLEGLPSGGFTTATGFVIGRRGSP